MGKNQIVAFDFGSKNIKLAIGVNKNKHLSLKKYVIVSTPEGAIFDGKIHEKEKIVTILKKLMKEYKIKREKIMISISSGETILRTLDFPKMKEKELRGAVKFEIEQFLPEPIDNYVIDFTVRDEYQEEVADQEMVNMIKVEIATLPKRIIETYLSTFKEIGIKIDVIDIQSNNIKRLFERNENNYLAPSENPDKNIAFIDLGNEKTNITILEYGNVFLYRSIPRGERNSTHIISKVLNLNKKEAEKWKRKHLYKKKDHCIDSHNEIEYYLQDFMDQVSDVINYFVSRSIQKRLDYIYLIGGGSKNQGISEYFEKYIKITTKLGENPINIEMKEKEDTFREELPYLWNVLGILLRKE